MNFATGKIPHAVSQDATTLEKPEDSPLNMRWGPFPLWHIERNPTFPLEPQKGPWHRWCTSRISPTYPSPLESYPECPATTPEEPSFSLLISTWGSISLLCRERNPGNPIAPQGEVVSTRNSRETPGVVPPFQKTPMSQSSPDTPDSPALTRLSRWISTQNMMAGVTALCHLGRKPQIPMST